MDPYPSPLKPQSETTPLTSLPSSGQTSDWKQLLYDLKLLRQGPRELWLTYLCGLLNTFALNTVTLVLVLYLTDDFHTTDWEAGVVSGLIGPIYAIVCLLEASIVDKVGVRFCFVFSGLVLCFSRMIIAYTDTKVVLYLSALLLMPIGGGLGISIVKYGVKKYTVPETRLVAYSLLYITLELGVVLSSLLIDTELTLGLTIFGFSTYQILIFQAGIGSLIFAFIGYFVRNLNYEETGENVPINYHENQDYWSVMSMTMARHEFRVLAATVFLLVFVRAASIQLTYTLPKYMLREIGPDAHFGFVLALRPAVLIVSAVAFTPLGYLLTSYKLILVGSIVSVVSCLLFLLGASYTTCILAIISLSIGEGIWNPRLYNYAIALSPRGLEGPFVALLALPWFLAIAVAGISSGVLIQTLCPEEGTRHCGLMWLIFAGMASPTPILMFLWRKRLDLNPKLLDIPRH